MALSRHRAPREGIQRSAFLEGNRDKSHMLCRAMAAHHIVALQVRRRYRALLKTLPAWGGFCSCRHIQGQLRGRSMMFTPWEWFRVALFLICARFAIMKFLIVFFVLLFSAPSFAEDKAERKLRWSDKATIERCNKQPERLPDAFKISCAMLNPTYLYYAYISFRDEIYKERYKPEHTTHYLRIEALGNTRHDVDRKIEILHALDIRHPDFEQLYYEAFEWAEHERTKSPDEIYKLSKATQEDLGVPTEEIADLFRQHYRLLAERMGHEGAHLEQEKIRKDILDRLMKEHPEDFEHLSND